MDGKPKRGSLVEGLAREIAFLWLAGHGVFAALSDCPFVSCFEQTANANDV